MDTHILTGCNGHRDGPYSGQAGHASGACARGKITVLYIMLALEMWDCGWIVVNVEQNGPHCNQPYPIIWKGIQRVRYGFLICKRRKEMIHSNMQYHTESVSKCHVYWVQHKKINKLFV